MHPNTASRVKDDRIEIGRDDYSPNMAGMLGPVISASGIPTDFPG